MPFQMQLMFLELTSMTLLSQLISWKTGVMPSSSKTAVANSVSKPVSSPFSSL